MSIFGIIPVQLIDLFEIALVTFLLYRLYMMMRGTLAVSILMGALALYVVQLVVQLTDMKILSALFGALSEVYLLAAIIVFVPEIRRVLRLIVQNPLVRRFFGSTTQQAEITETVAAARVMSEQQIGALIAFQRVEGLRNYVESGQRLHAEISRDLITSIFYSKSSLHDGAVIVANGCIEAARCILPVSKNMQLDSRYGTRHRAAVGLTEETDAVVVIVSEETGSISVAMEGRIVSGLSPEILRVKLSEALNTAASFEPAVA